MQAHSVLVRHGSAIAGAPHGLPHTRRRNAAPQLGAPFPQERLDQFRWMLAPADSACRNQMHNLEVSGAARLHRAASVLMDGVGLMIVQAGEN